eukprot:6732535-Pyramimonas_sp.AAC.1
MVSSSGERLGVLKGPLWAPWPQTPQGSEFGALAWTAVQTEGPAKCYSDCANVVYFMKLGAADGISAKRQYAGQIIQARHYCGPNLISLTKVEAHKDVDEEGLSARERFLRRGNFYAD